MNATNQMRNKSILRMSPGGSGWTTIPAVASRAMVTQDLRNQTMVIPVANTSLFKVGDWVIVRNKITEEWITEHKEPGWSGFASQLPGMLYCRKVLSINATQKTLAIGNAQITIATGWGEEDSNTAGNAGYDAHASYAIYMDRVRNCWIRNVKSYAPTGNTSGAHILSNGVLLN